MEGFGTPNLLAHFLFFAWIPIGLLIFGTTKPLKAALIVYLGGILLLPEHIDFDLPLVPPILKSQMAGLVTMMGLLWRAPRRFRGGLPNWMRFIVLGIAFSAGVTAQQNSDPQIFGPLVLPGHEPTELIGLPVNDLLGIAMPFYIGFLLVKSEVELKTVLKAFVVGALIMVPLILIEVRFSPQLHRILYGYHQHVFGQTVRFGGFRPMIFLQHGLALAMYMLVALIAAFTGLKAKVRLTRFSSKWVAWGMWVALVIVKSVGALVMSLVMIPAILVTRPKRQMLLVAILSACVVVYPILKITDTFPDEQLVGLAESLINAERAESLAFRFENDILLVERAAERKWFGWGSYGRGRVFDEFGYDIAVTDGYWVIVLGARGFVGLGFTFAVLVLPLLFARRRMKKVADPQGRILLGGLALMVLVSAFDLLPNGLYNSIPFFLAGALLSASQVLSRPAPPPVLPPPPLVVT